MRNIVSLMLVLGIVAGLAPCSFAGTTKTTKSTKHTKKVFKVGASKSEAAAPAAGAVRRAP